MRNMTEKKEITRNGVRAWLLAARPKTLSAAAVPVVMATALAWRNHGVEISWVAAALCLLFAFAMQIDANFINDYFDFVRGNDDETRLGPKRACAEGWISTGAMRIAIVVTTALSCVIGLPLIYFGGWEMIGVGVACVVFCFLYTTTLSYIAMGDVLVLVFFGLVPVYCTYYVETAHISTEFSMEALMMALSCGLVIDTLLIVNNYRDIDNDARAGKRTIAVFLGRTRTQWLYLLIVPVALAIVLCMWWGPVTVASCVIVMSRHVRNWMEVRRIVEGHRLNEVLGATSKMILFYGLLSSASIILL